MSDAELKHAFWTPANVALVTGGNWLTPPADSVRELAGVSIDTRTLRPGEAYVAIKGERFDGHHFVTQAAEAGAAMALVSCPPLAPGEGTKPSVPLLLVDDTVDALQRLASAYRDVLAEAGTMVIAVAGSNGKTTTRHMLHTVLTHAGKTGTQSPKSFNNHIGVPLTLLAAGAGDHFVVVEIGSNHPGEVAALAKIVRPDVAVVVSIGREHLEFFGTLEAVTREELSVLEHVGRAGMALLPADELLPIDLTALDGLPRSPGRETRFDTDPGVPDDLPLLGGHNRRNAAAVAAIARWMGLDDAAIADGLRATEPVDGRMQLLRFGDVTVVHDAYNANPDSMRAALSSWGDLEAAGRRVVVLGDMFELGETGPVEHRGIGEEVEADMVVTIGPLAMFIAEAASRRLGNERVHAFPQWTDVLPGEIATLLEPGDTVLLKASRGMRLERLIPAIETRFGRSGGPSLRGGR